MSRDVHSAAASVRGMRIRHRIPLHGPQVPGRSGGHATGLAGSLAVGLHGTVLHIAVVQVIKRAHEQSLP
jgi:hypothetical protein